jgi:hypothetical protein
LGVDIGQSIDPTALVCVQAYRPQIPDAPWPELRFRVHWVERLPLGTMYDQVVERIASVAEAAQSWGNTTIVCDATGVGAAVRDMLRKRTGIGQRYVTFTAGDKATQDGPFDWHVPKRDLIAALEVVLQGRRLETVPDCPLVDDLMAELAAFDFGISPTGHDTYGAQSGQHDDLVMALAMAIWYGLQPGGAQAEAFHELARQRLAERRQ